MKTETKVRYCVRVTVQTGRSYDIHAKTLLDYDPKYAAHVVAKARNYRRNAGRSQKTFEAMEEVVTKTTKVLTDE